MQERNTRMPNRAEDKGKGEAGKMMMMMREREVNADVEQEVIVKLKHP